MEPTYLVRASTSNRSREVMPISGPDGPLVNRYAPEQADLDAELSQWVQALWSRRVTRLSHSRWNTRWASLIN